MQKLSMILIVLVVTIPIPAVAQAVDWGATEEEVIAAYAQPDSIKPRFAPPTVYDPVTRDLGGVTLFYFTHAAHVQFVISMTRTSWSPELGLTMVIYGAGRPGQSGPLTGIMQRTSRTHPSTYDTNVVSLADAPPELIELLRLLKSRK